MSMKEDDFADWYLDIVEKANLSDKTSARSSTPPTTTRSASP